MQKVSTLSVSCFRHTRHIPSSCRIFLLFSLWWKRIECTEPVAPDSEERRMRTIESINDEILKELEKVL